MTNQNIILSICCVTYNHGEYIRQTIDAMLSQKVSFSFEILIHDDASTDMTAEIIKEYQYKYPDKIFAVCQIENQWLKYNRNPLTEILFPLARGKYIALCEGDDYWLNSDKLQQQIDYLEENTTSVLCGHRVYKLQNGKLEDDQFEPGLYNLAHVIDNGRVSHTVSWVYRNILSKEDILFINQMNANPSFYSGDQLLQLLLLVKGNAFVMENYMAVYRKHASGVMQHSLFRRHHNLGMFLLLRNFNAFTKGKYEKLLRGRMLFWLDQLVRKDLDLKNKVIAGREAFRLDFLLGAKYAMQLPYYMIKSVLYTFAKR